MSRIVLFGASGYTGRMAAQLLAQGPAPLVLAGRNRDALQTQAQLLGADDVLVTQVGDDALVDALHRDDVLVTTVGPFTTVGHHALDAAIESGATYIDSAGESGFHRHVFTERHEPARSTGAALVTGCGADWLPGNVAGAHAVGRAPEAVKLEIDYVITGDSFELSGGSAATGQVLLANPLPPYALRGGRVIDVEPTTRTCTLDGITTSGNLLGTTECLALPRTFPHLTDIDVTLAMPADLTVGTTGGPDDKKREANGQIIVARAYDGDSRLLTTTRLDAANGYDYTASMLAHAATSAWRNPLTQSGALGPIEAFGYTHVLAWHEQFDVHVRTITPTA